MLTAKIYKTIEQRKGRKVAAILSESQFWGPEKIQKYQFEKIKIIIDYRDKNCLIASELASMGFEI